MHPTLLLSIASTGVHIDLSGQSCHPDLLLELMAVVVKADGHLSVKGVHPDLMVNLAKIGGKRLTIKWGEN